MEWDTRLWSFFIWLIGTAVYLAGFATPYDMFGNRVSVYVSFGGDVYPGAPRYGLWGDIPEELTKTMLAVEIILCIPVACAVITLIGYILLFKLGNPTAQILAFVSQLLGGVLGIVGIAVYRGNSDQLGEGWWMCCMAACLYILNGVVLIFMPVMEYQVPSWKGEKSAQQVALLSIKRHQKV